MFVICHAEIRDKTAIQIVQLSCRNLVLDLRRHRIVNPSWNSLWIHSRLVSQEAIMQGGLVVYNARNLLGGNGD